MRSVPFRRPARVIALSYALVAAGALALLAIDALMLRYAEAARDTDFRHLVAEANEHLLNRNFPAARALIDRAVRIAPHAPEPQVALGHLHYRLGHWEQAITAYRDAIAAGSMDPGIRQNVVWCFIELARYDDAVRFGEAALEEGLTAPALQRYIAEACFRAKKYEEAIAHYETALKSNPKDLYLLDHLRQSFRETGQDEKALRVRERISAIEAEINRIGGTVP